jgi:hypothetical protein
MLVATVVAFGLAAAGLLLMVRGLVGTTTPLTAVVAELHRPRTTASRLRRDIVVGNLAGAPSPRRDADLAVCERDLAGWVTDRCRWAALGTGPGLVLVVFAAAGAVPAVRVTMAVAATAVGAVAGWWWARVDLASDAAKARRAFRHALASYLQLVTILMAGGAGVETAMFDAAAVGTGRAFGQLRAALTTAQARREPPWGQLGALGTRIGVRELEELQAAMTLAGGGAQVRESLTAKAAAITANDLAAVEAEAQARSETMVLPVALMFAGFLVLLGYPALAALSTP